MIILEKIFSKDVNGLIWPVDAGSVLCVMA